MDNFNNDEELVFTHNELLGTMAHFIVSQSPYIPLQLSETIEAFDKWIKDNPPEATPLELPDMILYRSTYRNLQSWVYRSIKAVPLLNALNLSLAERSAGLTSEDVDNSDKRGNKIGWVSRYDSIKKEHDFVDLGALARNVVNYLKWDHNRLQAVGDHSNG